MKKDYNAVSELYKLLSKKISSEYVISCKDYPNEISYIDIVFDAYKKANELFNPYSGNSISVKTLNLYMERVDEILVNQISNQSPFEAILYLFKAIIKIQNLLNSGKDTLTETFSHELIANDNYYSLFDIDYYLEKARINNIESCLAELEEDVNIRANTYFNAAYNAYIDILPGFEEFIKSID